jgi:hypothetical protein
MIQKLFSLLMVLSLAIGAGAQELQARLSIVTDKVSSQTDKKVFQTLQGALTNFLNGRKWTSEAYQSNEKIKCNFLINIDEDMGNNMYKGTITVQAARPVFNSMYESPSVNFMDNELTFKYVEFNPIEFNDNRVQGTDPMVANLPAVLAYYVYIILGVDYDSFAPRGGDPYFQKAQNIVNNAPEGRDIAGWKSFDGIRNRFRLIQNLTDSRFALAHDAIYTYYRTGLDQVVEKEDEARKGVLNALTFLNTLNTNNPNSMFLPFFFGGKSKEMARLFARADADTKARARELLLKLDVTNTATYKELK